MKLNLIGLTHSYPIRKLEIIERGKEIELLTVDETGVIKYWNIKTQETINDEDRLIQVEIKT